MWTKLFVLGFLLMLIISPLAGLAPLMLFLIVTSIAAASRSSS